LPTRAECSAVVFSEASAFGLPILSTNTGGVSDYVKNGINGYCLPLEAKGRDYAEIVHNIFHDTNKLSNLRSTTRDWYERELSWEKWKQGFENIIKLIK
jgi:glycosyltransferase involved in cell wall biosynthesis